MKAVAESFFIIRKQLLTCLQSSRRTCVHVSDRAGRMRPSPGIIQCGPLLRALRPWSHVAFTHFTQLPLQVLRAPLHSGPGAPGPAGRGLRVESATVPVARAAPLHCGTQGLGGCRWAWQAQITPCHLDSRRVARRAAVRHCQARRRSGTPWGRGAARAQPTGQAAFQVPGPALTVTRDCRPGSGPGRRASRGASSRAGPRWWPS